MGPDEPEHIIARSLLERTATAELEKQMRQEEDKREGAKHTIPKSLEYSNGDRYVGGLIVDPVCAEDEKMMMARLAENRFLRHGGGKMVYSNGMVYEGKKKCALKWQRVEYLILDIWLFKRSVVTGSWHLGMREGKGTLVFPGGLGKYEGGFHMDFMEGDGTLNLEASERCGGIEELLRIYRNGNEGLSYTGSFLAGSLHGVGTLKSDAGTYQGTTDSYMLSPQVN